MSDMTLADVLRHMATYLEAGEGVLGRDRRANWILTLRDAAASAEALDEAQRLVADHKQCADGYFDALMEVRAALTDARVLLAECRPVIERADAVFLPPKGTCTWGPAERDALLARLDALGGEA